MGISEVDVEPQFPFTAHLTLTIFILVFCLVIMNLLVGIAVSDIRQIVKTSKTDQLMAQVELACSVLNFSKTKTFEYLPTWIQNKFRRMLDCPQCRTAAECSCRMMKVKYSDPSDDSLPQAMKKVLYDFCIK